MNLVECGPNISDGRHPEFCEGAAEAAAAVAGMTLLTV